VLAFEDEGPSVPPPLPVASAHESAPEDHEPIRTIKLEPKRALPRTQIASPERDIEAALSARHLDLADLADDPGAQDLLDKWERSPKNEAEALERRIARLPITPPIVKRHLARLSDRLAKKFEGLTAEARAPLEQRYFKLRARLLPQSNASECEALLGEIASFEHDL